MFSESGALHWFGDLLMKHYDWVRFWSESGADVLLDDKGYLLDPGTPAAKYHEHLVFPLEHFADRRCLVLLGEPGIGKSKEARTEFERVIALVSAGRDLCRYLRLETYSSEDRLV